MKKTAEHNRDRVFAQLTYTKTVREVQDQKLLAITWK